MDGHQGHQISLDEAYRLFGVTDEERDAFLGSPSHESYLRARQEAKNQLSALQARMSEHLDEVQGDIDALRDAKIGMDKEST